MTLNELRYIVALAEERNFRRAAERVFVTQPALSLAVAKLEDELAVSLFERGRNDVTPTPIGARVVEQARRVLQEAGRVKDIAVDGRDDLKGAVRLGVIYTVGPWLIPALVPELHKVAPGMPLALEENLTAELTERLKDGRIDVAILAAPFEAPGLSTMPLYDEDFVVVVPKGHPFARRKAVEPGMLKGEPLLRLGEGHCFADQVAAACPGSGESARTLEGNSLETIRNMVASGLGITVLPRSAAAGAYPKGLLVVVPFTAPAPSRRIVLAWRESWPREGARAALAQAVRECGLPGVSSLPG